MRSNDLTRITLERRCPSCHDTGSRDILLTKIVETRSPVARVAGEERTEPGRLAQFNEFVTDILAMADKYVEDHKEAPPCKQQFCWRSRS